MTVIADERSARAFISLSAIYNFAFFFGLGIWEIMLYISSYDVLILKHFLATSITFDNSTNSANIFATFHSIVIILWIFLRILASKQNPSVLPRHAMIYFLSLDIL